MARPQKNAWQLMQEKLISLEIEGWVKSRPDPVSSADDATKDTALELLNRMSISEQSLKKKIYLQCSRARRQDSTLAKDMRLRCGIIEKIEAILDDYQELNEYLKQDASELGIDIDNSPLAQRKLSEGQTPDQQIHRLIVEAFNIAVQQINDIKEGYSLLEEQNSPDESNSEVTTKTNKVFEKREAAAIIYELVQNHKIKPWGRNAALIWHYLGYHPYPPCKQKSDNHDRTIMDLNASKRNAATTKQHKKKNM